MENQTSQFLWDSPFQIAQIIFLGDIVRNPCITVRVIYTDAIFILHSI